VGGDLIRVNQKYKDPFSTRPTARLMFCTNDLPHISDRSNATWRRMILLPFTQVIPPADQNRNLEAELTKELPGIWNWAFEGLKLLRARGSFPEPQIVQDAVAAYKREVSPVRQWLEEMCIVGADHKILTDAAFTEFQEWNDRNGYGHPSRRSFGRSLAAATSEVKKVQRRVEGRVQYFYQGLYIVPDNG
jgi:putative DNA primase/helicase